jgi:hypothetical protein
MEKTCLGRLGFVFQLFMKNKMRLAPIGMRVA